MKQPVEYGEYPIFHRVFIDNSCCKIFFEPSTSIVDGLNEIPPQQKHLVGSRNYHFQLVSRITSIILPSKATVSHTKAPPEVPMQMIPLMDKTQNPTAGVVMLEAAKLVMNGRCTSLRVHIPYRSISTTISTAYSKGVFCEHKQYSQEIVLDWWKKN